MKIEILGAGCAKCRATKKEITRVIQDLQVDAEVVEVNDLDEIIDRGVMVTPGVFVDGELKSTGRVPSKEDVEGLLSARSDDSEVVDTNNTQTGGPCACFYYAMEQARTGKKKPYPLYTVTCKGCRKSFSSNIQKDYCFDCEKKRQEE